MLPDPDYSDVEHDSLDVPHDSLEPSYAFPKDDLLYDSLQPIHSSHRFRTDAFELGGKFRINPLSFQMPGILDDDEDYEDMVNDHNDFEKLQNPGRIETYALEGEQTYLSRSECTVSGEYQDAHPEFVDIPMLKKSLRSSRDNLREEVTFTPILSSRRKGKKPERVEDELADSDFDSFERKRSDTDYGSTEGYYDTPEGDIYDPSLPYFPPDFATAARMPLKSALKGSRLHVNLADDNDIYDPSLPPIPLMEEEPLTGLKSALKGSVRSRLSNGSELSDITSISPGLDDWHETLGATSRMGWAIILYHAVRNNFKPHAFARLAFQVVRP